jgi:hypothetical protein
LRRLRKELTLRADQLQKAEEANLELQAEMGETIDNLVVYIKMDILPKLQRLMLLQEKLKAAEHELEVFAMMAWLT